MAARSPALAALGVSVRERRHSRGLSQEELALESGLDRAYVGGIERGERNPTVESLLKLAAALDAPASELLARTEEQICLDSGITPQRCR